MWHDLAPTEWIHRGQNNIRNEQEKQDERAKALKMWGK